nr:MULTISPECIES: SDR family oxidoreductase [unclassified Chelatococcus]
MVTGSAGALGRACADMLAASDFRVAASDIRDLPGWAGADRHFVRMDVTDEVSVRAAFDSAEAALGPIAVLVCCAGGTRATRDRQPSIADTDLSDWIGTEALNARGTFLCIRDMLRRRRRLPLENGRIILTSSAAAQRPALAAGAAYCASKAAVLGLARVAAVEAAALGMTLNVIAPGGFDTDAYHLATDSAQMHRQISAIPLGRLGRPDEFAATVRFLASVEAGYLTGATIDLNGGARMA